MKKWFELLSILAQEYICGDETNQVDRAWHCIDQALNELANRELNQPWIGKTGREEYIQSYEIGAAFPTAKRGILMDLTMEVARHHREVGWVKFLWEEDGVGPFVAWILEGAINSLD